MSQRLNYWKAAPEAANAVMALEKAVRASGLEASLLHLVKLRASQINGCAFCIDMHAREAIADGDEHRRLHVVAAWRESALFTPREQAALRWTEALTNLANAHPDDDAYAQARAEFAEDEIVKLTVAIGAINVWNRLSVGFGTELPQAEAA